MIYRKKKFKAAIVAVVIFSTLCSFAPCSVSLANAAEETSSRLTFEEEQGSILHAWNWSFNTIRENLQAIAEAGYTSIQVSPIQGNKDLEGKNKDTKDWWVLYQPINFKIGNKQLGTREEFKEMCAKSKEYGINIYVDVIANHTGNTDRDENEPNENIDKSIKELGDSAYHTPLHSVGSWDDRYEVTHGCVGLPDLNTENPKIQNMFRDFLKDCLACGADGFRVDTAKHIGLPTDTGKSQSDFWPNAFKGLTTEEGKEPYVYAEVLQGGADNFNEYSKYLNLTSSNYGNNVRKSVGLGSDVDVSKIEDYDSNGVDSRKLITWVESHDTYANKSEESTKLTDEQIKDGWALIASRADANPLFFNRPKGRGKLDGKLGEQGNDLWRDADVVAVNKFRKSMKDKDEKLVEIDKGIMIIERGSGEGSGAVIVNMDSEDKNISEQEINLEDGVYSNLGASDSTFEVKDSKMNGTIKKGITVLYKSGQKEQEFVSPKVSINPDNKSFDTDTLNLTLNCENTSNASYSINDGEKKTFTSGENIAIGKDSKAGDTINVTVEATNDNNSRNAKETYSYIKKDKDSNATVYFKKDSKFKTAYLYAYNEIGEENAKWPGEKMTYIGNGTYKYELKDFTDCSVIINDSYYGSTQTRDLKLKYNDKKIYSEKDESWNVVTEDIPENENAVEDGIKNSTSKVYLKKPDSFRDYDDVYVYFYGQGSGPDWPGVPMEKVDGTDDLYTYTLPEGKENSMVLFNANEGKVQVPKDTGFKAPANSSYIYDGEWKEYLNGSSKVYLRKPSDWQEPCAYVWKDGQDKEIKKWPGIKMEKVHGTETLYSYNLPKGYGDAKVIFSNNGKNQTKNLELKNESSMIYENDEFRNFTLSDLEEPEDSNDDDKDKESITKVYFQNDDSWEKVKVYAFKPGTSDSVKDWPGVNAKDEGNNLYSYSLPKGFENATVIFNNDSGAQTKNLKTECGHSMICNSKSESLENMTKVYFKNTDGWKSVGVYCWNGGDNNGAWPGKTMTYYGDDLYGYEIPKSLESPSVIFNNNNKGAQTTEVKISNGETMILDENNEWREVTNEDFNLKNEEDTENKKEDEDNKSDNDEKDELTKAYFYNSEDWKDLKVYVYTEDKDGKMVKELEIWPGCNLNSESDKLYSYTLPKNFKNSVIIFNGYIEEDDKTLVDIENEVTTSAQVALNTKKKVKKQTENLKIKSGEIMIYKDGKWDKYVEDNKKQDNNKDENNKNEEDNNKKEDIKNENIQKSEIEKVSISGPSIVFETITANVTFKDNKEGSVSYKWQRSNSKDGEYTDIIGATSKEYKLTYNDEYKFIRVVVTNNETNKEMISDATSKVYARSTHHSSHHSSDNDKDKVEDPPEDIWKNDTKKDDKNDNNTNKDEEKKNDGWVLNSNNQWVYKENSKDAIGWKKVNDKWYFMNDEGIMQTKWVLNNGKWYYLNNSGEMLTGWVKDTDNKWYYLNPNGDMQVGWLKADSGKWYYLNDSGEMLTDWELINGVWYYFYENGDMACNTTIEGYKIDDNGAYVA